MGEEVGGCDFGSILVLVVDDIELDMKAVAECGHIHVTVTLPLVKMTVLDKGSRSPKRGIYQEGWDITIHVMKTSLSQER